MDNMKNAQKTHVKNGNNVRKAKNRLIFSAKGNIVKVRKRLSNTNAVTEKGRVKHGFVKRYSTEMRSIGCYCE